MIPTKAKAAITTEPGLSFSIHKSADFTVSREEALFYCGSMLMVSLHLLKVLTFGLLGFVFRPHWVLIAGMSVSVTIGSYAGTRVRSKVPEQLFRKLLRIVLTLLALRMIVRVF